MMEVRNHVARQGFHSKGKGILVADDVRGETRYTYITVQEYMERCPAKWRQSMAKVFEKYAPESEYFCAVLQDGYHQLLLCKYNSEAYNLVPQVSSQAV
jgi:hypothetical protein